MLQIHCIPRPSGTARQTRVFDAPSKFAFHHANAYEASGGSIVVDTFARDTIDFGGDLSTFSVEMYKKADSATTWRRLVCRHGESHAAEHDLRNSVAAMNRVLEFPAQLPHTCAGKPVQTMFCAVRSGFLLCKYILHLCIFLYIYNYLWLPFLYRWPAGASKVTAMHCGRMQVSHSAFAVHSAPFGDAFCACIHMFLACAEQPRDARRRRWHAARDCESSDRPYEWRRRTS